MGWLYVEDEPCYIHDFQDVEVPGIGIIARRKFVCVNCGAAEWH